MEELWKRFTSIFRRTRSLMKPDAESPSNPVSPAAPDSSQSPAQPVYVPVSKPDAIAKLCIPTGDELMDEVHTVLIDLLQKDLIYAVCTEDDPMLRYSATSAGKQYVEDQLQQAVDDMLGRMFDD